MLRVVGYSLVAFTLCCHWLSSASAYYSLEVGDPCPTRNYVSSCQPSEQCSIAAHFIQSGRITMEGIINCGYTRHGEKICCPVESDTVSTQSATERVPPTLETTTTSTTTTTAIPGWFNLFQTNREYLQRSVAQTVTRSVSNNIVFPDATNTIDSSCRTPLYEGKCQTVTRCQNLMELLQQHRLRDEDVLTCRTGTTEEVICCPTDLPLQPRKQIGTESRLSIPETTEASTTVSPSSSPPTGQQTTPAPVTASAVELLTHYKYLAALAFPNAAFDGHVHRCTAMLLSPQLLLSSAGCGRPSHGVFGVADLQDVDEEEDDLVHMTKMSIYRQDLMLLRLNKRRQGEQATICSYRDQARPQSRGQIVATAWAKGNETDCPLYELSMRLLPTAACKNITSDAGGGVQDLPARHMCLEPKDLSALHATDAAPHCAPCPAAVGSVLHLVRPDGNRCVLGIATPSSVDNCDAQLMYYTSLLDRQLVKFVTDLQTEQT